MVRRNSKILLFIPFWVFRISVKWCFLTGVWMTGSLMSLAGHRPKSGSRRGCLIIAYIGQRGPVLHNGDKVVNIAARPPKDGPTEAEGLLASSLLLSIDRPARMPDRNVPTQSCLVLCFFFANLLLSFFMWLIFSSLSPHNLHLLFCCVLSILALIGLVLMALFCAAITRDWVSLLRFPFFSLVHVFSCCEMSLVSCLKHP